MDEQNKTSKNDTQTAAVKELNQTKPKKKRRSKHDFKDGLGRVFANRHKNGGGWVAATAHVDDSVYVARNAQVYGCARVYDKVDIRGRAQVYGSAVIRDHVRLSGDVVVNGAAKINDAAELRCSAKVSGSAIISGVSYIGSGCVITDSAQIVDSRITDNVLVWGRPLIVSTTVGFIFGGSSWVPLTEQRESNPENRSKIHGTASLQKAVVKGKCDISGNAVINDASLCLETWQRESPGLKVRGQVSITKSRIYAPLAITSDSLIVDTTISAVWPSTSSNWASYSDEDKDAYLFNDQTLVRQRINSFTDLKERIWDRTTDQFVKRANDGAVLGQSILENNGARRIQRAGI